MTRSFSLSCWYDFDKTFASRSFWGRLWLSTALFLLLFTASASLVIKMAVSKIACIWKLVYDTCKLRLSCEAFIAVTRKIIDLRSAWNDFQNEMLTTNSRFKPPKDRSPMGVSIRKQQANMALTYAALINTWKLSCVLCNYLEEKVYVHA